MAEIDPSIETLGAAITPIDVTIPEPVGG
jgi:hypothetical protein